MLSDDMQALIRNFSAGSVATVNADGSPSVSPKATFVILDETIIAFGNLRSPGTVENITRNPSIEVCFTDILARRAVRVSGTATLVAKSDAGPELRDAYAETWAPYVNYVRSFVVISITATEMIWSPAYDVGFTEAELRSTNLSRLMELP